MKGRLLAVVASALAVLALALAVVCTTTARLYNSGTRSYLVNPIPFHLLSVLLTPFAAF